MSSSHPPPNRGKGRIDPASRLLRLVVAASQVFQRGFQIAVSQPTLDRPDGHPGFAVPSGERLAELVQDISLTDGRGRTGAPVRIGHAWLVVTLSAVETRPESQALDDAQ